MAPSSVDLRVEYGTHGGSGLHFLKIIKIQYFTFQFLLVFLDGFISPPPKFITQISLQPESSHIKFIIHQILDNPRINHPLLQLGSNEVYILR